MERFSNGVRGELIVMDCLKRNGIRFVNRTNGIGPDFIAKNGATIDAKYSAMRTSKPKYKDKIYRINNWTFNFHSHGTKQCCDFFVCVAEIADNEHRIFVIPSSVYNKKTFSISTTQMSRNIYSHYENNFQQIKEWPVLMDINKIAILDQKGGSKMKKIIDGLRYDTSKAIEIGSYDNIGREASGMSDFRYWEATLYKTPRSGRYFLAGEGGAMSRFAQSAGQNSWTGGSDIIPVSREEALEWAESYLEPDVIEEFFGDLIEEA